MEEIIKSAKGLWDRMEDIIKEGSQERGVFLKGRRELKLLSTSWQVKNSDTEKKPNGGKDNNSRQRQWRGTLMV